MTVERGSPEEKRARFDAQVLPHLDAAYRFARWLARSPADADDVVQEAILRAFRGFDGLRGADVKAWLFAIVRNCHLTALAQRERRGSCRYPRTTMHEDGHAMVSPAPGPGVGLDAARRGAHPRAADGGAAARSIARC